jgi:SAM-dependent methyltransferase
MSRNKDSEQSIEPWIEKHAPLLHAGGTLLDVACGYGRHARFFAARGHIVTAVDRDADAIASLQNVANIHAEQRDLEGDGSIAAWPYPKHVFDAIVVCNYLWRPTFAEMLDSLKLGGVLIYETFMDGNERYGKPSRPDFLLRSNELLERSRGGFTVRAYEEGEDCGRDGHTLAVKARVVAIRIGL